MEKKTLVILLIAVLSPLVLSSSYGGNKRLMSVGAAKVLAERALVESIYGLQVRSTEEVIDMVAANFTGKTESKTSTYIRGIQIISTNYNPENDIAQATATVTIGSLKNIEGQEMNLMGKTFTRTAFATSTPANAGIIRAFRAAEVDAYKQLAKSILGFTLESKTTVEDYLLTSDLVKTKMLATVYLARVDKYDEDVEGNVSVKMFIRKSEIEEILGMNIPNVPELIVVTGEGAQHDDFKSGR